MHYCTNLQNCNFLRFSEKVFKAYIQCILAHDAKMLSHDEANLAQSVKKNIKKIYITASDPNMLFSLG